MSKIPNSNIVNGIPEISPEETFKLKDSVELIDVREMHEYQGELGHIPGSKLVTLGPDIIKDLQEGDKNREIIFICRSGARSGKVTEASLQMGYTAVANMTGGMLRWNELKYPIEK